MAATTTTATAAAAIAAGAVPPSFLRGVGAFVPPVPVARPAAVGVRPRLRPWPRGTRTRAATSSVPSSAAAADFSAVESPEAPLRLEKGTWTFRDRHPVAYEVASSEEAAEGGAVPILLLNGFGVGSFHQHRLMRRLLLEGQNSYEVYGVDYLGQGSSWPTECDDGESSDERGLGYSADTWLDQIEGFVEEVVLSRGRSEEKVHLVGNSVGGYLATMLARRRPDLVDSLVLLNATPVWGLNLPGWDGRLPAPLLPKLVGRTMFDFIRDLDTIDKYLEAAYVRREAYDGTFHDEFHSDPLSLAGGLNEPLGAKIRACTEGAGGHAAFASILWSAPASGASHSGRTSEETTTPADFYEALGSLSVDVLLLFGDDDPWCTSAVAKRMHVTLCDRACGGERDPPAQRYVALEGAGHCPNHEAPGAVAKIAARWIEGGTAASDGDDDGTMVRRRRRGDASLASEGEVASEPWGDVRVREVSIEESRNLGFVDRIVSAMVG